MHYTAETPQFRPVCTVDELARAAANAVYPEGASFDEAEHERIYRQALKDITALERRGRLNISQANILQESALAWWKNQLLPRPPARLVEIIAPPAGDPGGDFTLRQLERFAHGTEFSQKDIHKRILADEQSGRLTLATVGPADNFMNGSKVTRQAAIAWLLKNRFALPLELAT